MKNLFKSLHFFLVISPIVCVQHEVTDQAFLDISIDGEEIGRIVVGLFGNVVPKTVNNFKQLATTGIGGKNYTGTQFHRVVQKFMIQGGDVAYNNGSGVVSVYGYSFEDENFDVGYSSPGYIGMANSGPNTNGCQFFITTRSAQWLNGKHVVFGKVVDGQGIVHKIEHVKTDGDDKPLQTILVTKSGLIHTPNSFFVTDETYDFWAFIKAGMVPMGFSFCILGFFHWTIRKLDSFRYLQEEHLD